MPKHRHYIYNEKISDPVIKGQKGATGIQGQKGAKGEQGRIGRNGMDGHTTTIVGSFYNASPAALPKNGTLPVGWDDHTNPPVPFTLEVGESLMDTRTGELWCFTPGSNVSNWTKVGKISGPAGVDGRDGTPGPKGTIGATGTVGLDGAKGEPGAVGEKGDVGSDGHKGERGERGTTGAPGVHGSRGAKGEKGEAGEVGYDGYDGAKGQKGDAGETGSPGEQGLTGAKGDKGVKGDVGPLHLAPVAGGSIDTDSWEILDNLNILKIGYTSFTEFHVILNPGTLGGKNRTALVNGPDGVELIQCVGDNLEFSYDSENTGVVNFVVYQLSV